ncbi:MAG: alpha/beta fold hydrolase [Dehalococcoidia bacterium]
MTLASEYVQVNGVRLHCLRAGRGPRTIVLTHGNSHCGGVWAPLIEALADDEYTVVATDLRGHGWSEKPESGYHWGSLRDDLVGIVTALDLRDVLYVGHSRGGGVSLLAAAATPDRARGALVWEPTVPVQASEDGLPAPAPEPRRITAATERARSRRDSFASRDELVARYRGQDAFRGWRDDYFDSYLRYGTAERPDGTIELCMPARSAALLYEATFGFDAWRSVHSRELPLLILYGAESGRVRAGHDPAVGIRTMFPRCDTRIIAGATHSGPFEQPELFERAVREFAGTVAW